MSVSKIYFIKLLIITWIGFITSQDHISNQFFGQQLLNTRTGFNTELRGAQLPQDGQINEQICNSISSSVLRFAINLGYQLNGVEGRVKDCEVFSPVSIMSALSLLMLGAKNPTYQELANVFGLNYDPKAFHDQFSLMLEDLKILDNKEIETRRNKVPWRNTVAKSKIRKPTSKEAETPSEYLVKLANGLFIQRDYSLNRNYRSVITSIYNSNLESLDFRRNPTGAKNFINEWVEKNTLGRITNIITDDIPSVTNLIISSVLYFKAYWETPFYEAATNYDSFFTNGFDELPRKALMMATAGNYPFYDATNYDCRIIGLPYKGNLTTMYIIQPNNSSRTKLAQFQRDLTAEKIEEMISKMVQSSVILAMPKMKFSRNYNMKNLLSSLGIQSIFSSYTSDLSLIGDPERNYNYSTPKPYHNLKDRYNEVPLIFVRIGDSVREQALNSLDSLEQQRQSPTNLPRDIAVENILHKVYLDINEVGTEAAAATLGLLYRSGIDVLFRADAPFIILIRHDLTKLPLFYGIINDPHA